MATTLTRPRTRVVTVDKPERAWNVPAKATLTPIDPGHGLPPVYLVSIDEVTWDRFRPGVPAGHTIGGITNSKGGWTVVAYRDRDEFLSGHNRDGGWIPLHGRNLAHAVRMLLLWWRITKNTDLDVEAQPDTVWRNA